MFSCEFCKNFSEHRFLQSTSSDCFYFNDSLTNVSQKVATSLVLHKIQVSELINKRMNRQQEYLQ